MMLSEHFAVSEFLATQHRALAHLNEAAWEASPAARLAAETQTAPLLERVRRVLGVPLHISSGFRCVELNAAVGGRPTSRHVLGLAADVIPIGLDVGAAFRRVVAAMRAGGLPDCDEAILELCWIHIQAAADGPARQLALVTDDGQHFEAFA